MSTSLLSAPLGELTSLLAKSKKAKNPALYLYQNGARGILFELEGLMRLYRFVSNKKKYNAYYKEFKALEDTLGAIDYAVAMQEEFKKNTTVKKVGQVLFAGMLNEECGFLNDVLANSGMSDKGYFDGLLKTVKEDTKLEIDTVVHGAALLISKELTKVLKDLEKGKYDLEDLEEGIHELRRKIRWTCIYAQVFNGHIQLKKVTKIPTAYKAYCTKAITENPFNKMDKAPKEGLVLAIDAHHFYALSYLVGTLGELKDIGQRCMVLEELMNAAQIKDNEALEAYFGAQDVHPYQIPATSMDLLDQMLASEQLFYYIIKDLMR
jgi:hypothetical protein